MPNLHEMTPEQLEEYKQQEIDRILQGASPEQQRRLRGLQWRVDMEMRKCHNPTQRMLKAQQMMFDSLIQLNEAWNGPDFD